MSDSESGDEVLGPTCEGCGRTLKGKKVSGVNSLTGLPHMFRSNKECVACHKELKKGQMRYSCKKCDFHLCIKCFQHRSQPAPFQPPARPSKVTPGHSGAPVPEQIARGFIEALRQEYVRNVANAVGKFFERGVPPDAERKLCKFEDQVRKAPHKVQAIDKIEKSWFVSEPVEVHAAPEVTSTLPPIAQNKVDPRERIDALSTALAMPGPLSDQDVVLAGLKAADLEVMRIALSVVPYVGLTGSAEACSAEARIRAELKIPADWDIQGFAAGRRLTGGMGGREDSGVVAFQKQPDRVVKEIQDMFDATYRKVYTRDRRGAPIPDRFEVREVHRVMNDQVWREYDSHREKIRGRLQGSSPTVPGGGAHTMKHLDTRPGGGCLAPLDKEVNECWLFHGTTRAAAEGIAENDFRLDLTGSNAGTLYGKGIYLAENASKSDEYGEGPKGPAGDQPERGFEAPRPPPGPPPELVRESYILVCRSMLGRVNYNDERKPDPDRLVDSCRSGQFDSVLGDRLKLNGTFREIIVYNDDHVYPEFIVRYERIFFHERFAQIYNQMLQRKQRNQFRGPTPQEKEVLESMWNIYGMPNKGRINKWQLLDLLNAIKQPPADEGDDLDATFDEWDTKRDGWIDKDEFMQEMNQRVKDGIGLG